MKKTTNFLFGHKRFFLITIISIVFWGIFPNAGFSQVPSCEKFSVGVNDNGLSIIKVNEMVKNKPALPLYLTIRAINFNTIYEGQVTDLDAEISLELCPYIDKTIIYELKNNAGVCSDTLRVSLPPIPKMTGRKIEVLCSDPLTSPGKLIGDTFPDLKYPCGDFPRLKVSEDFLEVKDCQDYDESILQVIYREIEGYDNWGQRFSSVDTIIVYKHPEITKNHISLDSMYHLYCGENDQFGPKIIYNNPVTGNLDTFLLLQVQPGAKRQLKFQASEIAKMCNMSLEVSSSISNNTKCEKRYEINMELSQDCFYADGSKPLTVVPAKGLVRMERGRFRMSFSVVDVDTLAPQIDLASRISTTFTSSRECNAPLIIPPLTISEKCSGIRRVHASVPGYFTVNLKQNKQGKWVPAENIHLPKDGMNYMEDDTTILNAFKVYIEASDSCNLVSKDSFYIKVVDDTAPTVSFIQNIRVGLTGQLTWIDVSNLKENSNDNCGVALVLGRRTDWATAGNVHLCDGLETDKRINPVEAHYASYLQDLIHGNDNCGEWLYEEWMKDSIKYCSGNSPDDMIPIIGGGWSTQIPFTCEDACQDISVELLVIDNWCNWNTTRTTVKVRDKQPISIVQDLKSSISMNCSSYNNYYADIVNKAMILNNRPDYDSERVAAFESLDSLMGGYENVWEDLDGQLIANDGRKIIPSEQYISIRKDQCENYTERKSVKIFDEANGKFVNRIQDVSAIRTVPANERIENGIVAVNCSSSIYQRIFVDMDECGAGTVRRRFYVAAGCGEIGEGDWLSKNADRIEYTREQVIYIEPDCALSEGMLDMPPAVSAIDVCKIEKNPNGNYTGELHPDFTGWPKYTWSQECRNLTVGYQDKLYRLFGNNPVGQWKLVRNWHISDKCDGSGEGSALHFEQVLILHELDQCDSTASHYLINGNVLDPNGAPIENVSIKLRTDSEERVTAKSSIQGTFSILAKNDEMYTVIPYKNDEMLKGISTFDLVMIQKDILNIKRLDNVYQRIAADINNNGLIDASDVIELRKAILRPDFRFSNNTSYQFRAVGSKSNFAVIDSSHMNTPIDFVGIKIGDVNFSAAQAVPTSRSSGMRMVLQDQWLQEEVAYRIPVRNERDINVLGFQFEWDLNESAVSSITIEPGSLDISSEEYAVFGNDKMTVSWFDIDERHFGENEVLFYINIKTNRRTTLKNIIENSADILRTESYIEPGIVQDLSFFFREMQRSVSYIHNRPNPFRDRTAIRFDQDQVGPVNIYIYDITGKLILHRRTDGQKGPNEIIISGTELPGPGMYYYRVSSPDQHWTNKMIYIK